MRRREFIVVLGGAAAWPLAARGQQGSPVIGFLSSVSESVSQLPGFRRGLGEAGFVEHQNVMIEYRFATGQYERLPGMAAELVARQVALIIAVAPPAALAAKAATATVPVIFAVGFDPVVAGLVRNLREFSLAAGAVSQVQWFAEWIVCQNCGATVGYVRPHWSDSFEPGRNATVKTKPPDGKSGTRNYSDPNDCASFRSGSTSSELLAPQREHS